MDSDLAESVSALKQAFEHRKLFARFGVAAPELLQELRSKLRVPRRYREFLAAADPLDVEVRMPSEQVRLSPASGLLAEQLGFCLDEEGRPIARPRENGWRPSWVIVARSSLLGDPYFLDVGSPDPEGDCPVYTAMTGTEVYRPRLCASSFALFLRILAVGMELGSAFATENIDVDDEQTFRDMLGPRIREHDPAALKAGHWT